MLLSHQHIGEVMQAVIKKFGEFKGKNAMAGLSSKGQEASMQDMIRAMKSMPEYTAMMRQVAILSFSGVVLHSLIAGLLATAIDDSTSST